MLALAAGSVCTHPPRGLHGAPDINVVVDMRALAAGSVCTHPQAVSMAYPTEKTREERHKKVLNVWERLSGPDAPIGYDDATYKSESASADRNWCLGYMMKHDDVC